MYKKRECMKQIFKVIGILFIFCVLIVATISAQTVKGKIVDDKGDPIIGANVLEKGTSNGSITDVNGSFTLQLKSEKSTLEITYVGYQTKEIKPDLQKNNIIKIQEATTELSEYVVVGYAKQKKATLTGAVSAVQGETLTQRSVASLSTSLEGTMSGVSVMQTSGQPGSDGGTIRIRGIGSINSNTDPLVLVDGVEMSIDQVDMSTVESVSVLKDAASASIYGSRASNGVILITTKRGIEGKVKVSYSGYVASQVPTNMPEPVPAWQYLQSELDSWDNAGIQTTPDARAQRLQLIQDEKTYQPNDWDLYDTNWKTATLKNSALMQNHSVSISGGDNNIKYFAAGNYLDQGGLLKANDDFNRASLRINADAKITNWAKFSLTSNMYQSNRITPGVSTPVSIINTCLYLLPTLSGVKDLDGDWGYGKNGLNPTAETYDSGQNQTKNSEVMASGTLTITPIKDLNILGQYSIRKTDSRTRNYLNPYPVSLQGVSMGTYPGTPNSLTEGLSENTQNYYLFQGTYDKQINGHKFGALIGMQIEDNLATNISASQMNFMFGSNYLDDGDGKNMSVAGGASSWAMVSYLGRLNYNYKEKYLLELNGRYDGSSRFLPANRWGFFPSVSAGWDIAKEKFMESAQDYLSQLKIRASYGLLGNQNIGNNQNLNGYYPYTATINPGYSYWFGKQISSGVAQTNLSNPGIQWEKSKQTDIGIDVTLWNGLLGVTADYYNKQIYNMLMQFALPYYAGMDPAWTNAGDMVNKGWEVVLTHKNKIKDFTYNASFTLSDSRNKITNLNGYYSADMSLMVGYPVNSMWGYQTAGYFQTAEEAANSVKLSSADGPGYIKYVDQNNDGKLDNSDKIFLGDSYPHFEYGLRLEGSWRGIDVSVFVQGVGQRKAYMSGVGLKPFANGSNLFTHQLDSWTPDNPNAAYPILLPEANSADNFVLSDKWVKDASYGRLKNVVIGYTIPAKIMKKSLLSSARFYVSGQNLLTLSHFYKGYDPEVTYGVSGGVGGEFYPIMQTYTVGVDLSF